jgi:hypothetical protein
VVEIRLCMNNSVREKTQYLGGEEVITFKELKMLKGIRTKIHAVFKNKKKFT